MRTIPAPHQKPWVGKSSNPVGLRSVASLLLAMASIASAELTIPGNNGQDLAFSPDANIEIDLSLAATATPGAWETTASAGQGVYDPEQWAVIFRYTSVDVPANVTVIFKNHPSCAPVIWLVQDDVNIAGTIDLSGANGHTYSSVHSLSEPGPGGFRGGRGQDGTATYSNGLGPGASANNYGSGGYGSGSVANGTVYGNAGVYPLIGGSGGSGRVTGVNGCGGGAGGGAFLIATPGSISLAGTLRANGGHGTIGDNGNYFAGGGSGGGLRLICNTISGDGVLQAVGGGGAAINGGYGRIAVETHTNALTRPGDPPFALFTPPATPRIFRTPAETPSVRITRIGDTILPDDPKSVFSFPGMDGQLPSAGVHTVYLETQNVPTAGSVVNVVRTPQFGSRITTAATLQGGNETLATWTAQVNFGGAFSAIQARAVLP